LVSVANEELFKILMADPRQDSRIVNFIPVEMKNRQDGSVSDRVNLTT